MVAGLALGGVVPVAVAAYLHFTRPLGDVGTHGVKESVVLVTLGFPIVAAVGYALATKPSFTSVRTQKAPVSRRSRQVVKR